MNVAERCIVHTHLRTGEGEGERALNRMAQETRDRQLLDFDAEYIPDERKVCSVCVPSFTLNVVVVVVQQLELVTKSNGNHWHDRLRPDGKIRPGFPCTLLLSSAASTIYAIMSLVRTYNGLSLDVESLGIEDTCRYTHS
jgi:hypothetical protein